MKTLTLLATLFLSLSSFAQTSGLEFALRLAAERDCGAFTAYYVSVHNVYEFSDGSVVFSWQELSDRMSHGAHAQTDRDEEGQLIDVEITHCGH